MYKYVSVCFLCGSCGPLCGLLRGLLWSAFCSVFLQHLFSVICLSFAASATALSHNMYENRVNLLTLTLNPVGFKVPRAPK